MKNKLKIVVAFILGGIVFGGVVALAAIKIQANEVGYKNGTVEDALDNLYNQVSSKKTVCMLLSGTANTIGAKYACNPGDGVIRNFYLLKVDGNNVKLIMEQNLSDTVGSARTMNHGTALNYLKSGGAGYATVSAWTNVIDVDLPSAQDIADAGGITGWNVTTATADNWSYFGTNGNTDSDKGNRTPYAWLYNYTRGCVINGACTNEYGESDSSKAYGYWTKDLIQNDASRAWYVHRGGNLARDAVSYDTDLGVRPVITILKSGLSG